LACDLWLCPTGTIHMEQRHVIAALWEAIFRKNICQTLLTVWRWSST
jgi:hypothetical protein